MSFRTKFILVVFSATLAFYTLVGGWVFTSAQQTNDPGAQLRIFESVLQHINDDYVDEPDMNKVRAGALRGLAYGLDPYSTYLTVDQVREYRAGTDKAAVGIGAELSQVASYLYVIAPVKGGRAGARPFAVTVKRRATETPAAEARMEAGKIGVVRVNSLDAGEAADVQKRVQELQKQGAQKLVLDLRNVAGGSLDEGVKVANLFVKAGTIAQTLGRGNKSLKTFTADPKAAIFDGPVAVLID